LRIATLALVHSTTEYCAAVWCRSAHTRLIDPAINNALRIVTGCLRPSPADDLPILAGVQPAELRRNIATLSLARRAVEPRHLLHSALTRPPGADARLLISRHPFVPTVQHSSVHLCGAVGGSPMDCGVGGQPTRLRIFIPDTGTHLPRATLPRRAWV